MNCRQCNEPGSQTEFQEGLCHRGTHKELQAVKAALEPMQMRIDQMSRALSAILISHGAYGDGGNLDNLTKERCIAALQEGDNK